MVRTFTLAWLSLAWSCVGTLVGYAQNVTGYATIENPHLFLVREPAVVAELGLSGPQKAALGRCNEGADGQLLALRGWPADRQSETVARLIADSERRVSEILDRRQLQRLDEIKLQVRGIQSVGDAPVARQLQLTAEQTARVSTVLEASRREMVALFEQSRSVQDRASAEKELRRIRENQRRDILSVLSTAQRSRLQGLIGRRFDLSQLGHVKFRAPPLAQTDAWVNSAPIRITDLRGKVIALHFWAFG